MKQRIEQSRKPDGDDESRPSMGNCDIALLARWLTAPSDDRPPARPASFNPAMALMLAEANNIESPKQFGHQPSESHGKPGRVKTREIGRASCRERGGQYV